MLIDFSMKLLMPSSFENIKEIAFRTMASASKTEIKKVLESLCGLKIEKVRTLKKKDDPWLLDQIRRKPT